MLSPALPLSDDEDVLWEGIAAEGAVLEVASVEEVAAVRPINEDELENEEMELVEELLELSVVRGFPLTPIVVSTVGSSREKACGALQSQ